jgi:hypothetical protein
MMPYDEFEQFKSELEEVIGEMKSEQKPQRMSEEKKSSAEGRSNIAHPEDKFPYRVGDEISFREKGGEVITGIVSGYKNWSLVFGQYKKAKLIVKVRAEKGGKEDNFVVDVKDVLRKE